jgi:hypothetical protein
MENDGSIKMADSTTIPDNLGPNQTRVLDSANRNFESVVYQRKKPPLSCEVNLTGNLAAKHAQEVFQSMSASGWRIIGSVRDNQAEATLRVGDISCSFQLPPNTIRLIANDRGTESDSLIAWVNGEQVLVQGSSSLTDQNNTITLALPPASSSRVDFVFLEVWRKLITPEDLTIPRYGNVLYGGSDNFPNDLVDPAINIETTLRIQVQYRIRVVSGIDIEAFSDGFDPNVVFVQGPLTNPISTCDHAFFSQVPGDPGLWRAGVGDTAAQDQLQTVDGYTYAIPMFAINRRNSSTYDPAVRANGAGKTLADYLVGKPSDRPDDKYSNWIVADDILDLRHRIAPVENAKEIGEEAFQRLVSGTLRSKMGINLVGEDRLGPTLTVIDGVTPGPAGWYTQIGSPFDGIRRVFANAAVSQDDNIDVRNVNQKTGISNINGAPWAIGDQVQLSTPFPYPVGTRITSLDDAYANQGTQTLPLINDTGAAILVGVGPFILSNNGQPDTDPWQSETANINPPPLIGETLSATTWGPNRFIAVGQLGEIFISDSVGVQWKNVYSSGAQLTGVASGTTNITAVGLLSQAFYSIDLGETWAPATVAPTGDFNAVTWSDALGLFAAVGNTGAIATSPDGNFWTNLPPASIDDLTSIAWSPDLTLFVAVGVNGAIVNSADGITWSTALIYGSLGAPNYSSIAWGNGLFLLGGSNTFNEAVASYSIDGNTQIASCTLAAVTYQPTFSSIVYLNTVNKFILTNPGVSPGFIAVSDPDFFSNFKIQAPQLVAPDNVLGCAWGQSIQVNGLNSPLVTVEIVTAHGLGSNNLYFDYTIDYANGQNGFSLLPDKMLEIRQESPSTAPYIAPRDQDIRVRTADPVIINSDTTRFSTMSFRGANDQEPWNFGQQMIYDTTGPGSNIISFPNTLYNCPISGVASVSDGAAFRNIQNVSRTATTYTVQYSGAPILPTSPIELGLYTGLKFFDTNKQGRAILDSYQMVEFVPIESADGFRTAFTLDTGTSPIIAIASNETLNGIGFAYINLAGTDIYTPLLNNNVNLPTDSTKARTVIEFAVPPTAGALIRVPLLVHSPIEPGDGYLFFYRTVPYQGWLDSSSSSPIEAVVSSTVTTAGSGGISNYTVTRGFAQVLASSPIVNGLETDWSSSVQAGDIFYSDLNFKYVVLEVINDTSLIINSPSPFSTGFQFYHIFRPDRPATQANLFERLPTLNAVNDSQGINDQISTNVGLPSQTLETRIISRPQDIISRDFEDVQIGVTPADRGFSEIHITGENLLGFGNLGLLYEPLQTAPNFQKTYQSYVVNKDGNGELYLMVVGSETHNSDTTTMLNPNSNSDTVDMFRMPGRPLTVRRPV